MGGEAETNLSNTLPKVTQLVAQIILLLGTSLHVIQSEILSICFRKKDIQKCLNQTENVFTELTFKKSKTTKKENPTHTPTSFRLLAKKERKTQQIDSKLPIISFIFRI